jgi:hypothetical protein
VLVTGGLLFLPPDRGGTGSGAYLAVTFVPTLAVSLISWRTLSSEAADEVARAVREQPLDRILITVLYSPSS